MPAGVKPIGDWPGIDAGPGTGSDAGPEADVGCGASEPHRLRRRLFFSRFSIDSAENSTINNTDVCVACVLKSLIQFIC